MAQHNFTSIATIHSCYKEKFGIPRQPGLVATPAIIEIDAAYSQDEAFRELETFSHIWVIFVFHGVSNEKWNPTVRPPRLGGNQRIGVFASRSMFRPYADSINTLKAGYATEKPEIKFEVVFSKQVKDELKRAEVKHPKFDVIITEILQLDPRPAYQGKKQTKNEFAMKLYNYDLKWQIDNEQIIVTELTLLD